MTWIIAGLIAPFLWAITSIMDQVVFRKHYTNQPLFIMTINCLVCIVPFICLSIYDPSVFSVNLVTIGLLIGTSFVNAASFIAYYMALESDEASNAVPIFQLQPIFIFIVAYFLFGETITITNSIGVGLIIIAALSLVIDFETKKYNWRTLYLISITAIVMSSTTILDRYILKEIDWVGTFAWKSLGYVLFSCFIFSLKPNLFMQFRERLKHPIQNAFHYIFTIEILAIIANAFFLISLALAPAAGLTQTLCGLMPFFVLALGYAGYKLAPEYVKKPKQGFHLGWHLTCLVVMLVGVYLIY